jgi:two-component system, LuxR family, sensor kinase FixL
VRDILADIIGEDRRAGEVIRRLRALLKRGETASVPVSLNEAIEDVLRLAQGDLIERGVAVVRALAEGLPEVKGDRVQLQQVMLNLISNGADAMSVNPPGARLLHMHHRASRQRRAGFGA